MKKTSLFLTAIFGSLLLLIGCGSSGGPDSGNGVAVTVKSVGKKLFFDTSLSSNGNQSCGSCHDPASGFADPNVTSSNPVSEGSLPNVFGARNAPTAAYASFIPLFTRFSSQTTDATSSQYRGGQFVDGRSASLVEQAKAPFLNPLEMNNTDKADVVSKVSNASYADEFRQVFGDAIFSDVELAYQRIAEAIATFESSSEMNSFSSKFDAVEAGQASFTDSEQRGFELFTGTQAKCANCHTVDPSGGGPTLFSDFSYYNVGTPPNPDNPAGAGFIDDGLGDANRLPVVSDESLQRGKFRTPTLRNVALTAPYMHNGVYQTLEEVIRHYDLTVANADGFIGPYPEVDVNIANELNFGTFTPLGLTSQDYLDLENFMKTLSDGFQ